MSDTRQVLKAVSFLLAIISTTQSPPNSSKEPQLHTSNSSFPTSRSKPPENTASGDLSDPSQFRDSDNGSTETYFLPDTKPITTRKSSGTTPQTPVQFLTEASSNRTDKEEENGAGSEEVDTWIIALAVVASVVFLIIAATTTYRYYKRPRGEQVGTSEHVESHTVDESASDQGIP